MHKSIKHRPWLWLLPLFISLQGCTLTTARLNIGKALHGPWESAREQDEPNSWQEAALATVKLEKTNSKPLLKQRHKSTDPVGEILQEKSWDPPKVRWVVERYDYEVRQRIKADFDLAGVPYPPTRLAFLAFKKERRLEVWASDAIGPLRRIKDYPFTAFSGQLGPKRRVGDGQIPEGIYRITALNPDSAYHLSMKLNYPNEFDREMAARDQRYNLGGDIFIHGDSRSIGCIPLGNRGIEELFVLTALAGAENTQVIVAPYDMRTDNQIRPLADIPWTRELYTRIRESIRPFHRDRAGEETVATTN